MARALYIGGFGNGKTSAEGVGEALVASGHYEDATTMTFAHAMDNPHEVAMAAKSVDTFTHSAGLLALEGTKPKEIVSVGAPLPTTVPRLMVGTGKKTARMVGHSLTGGEAFKAVNKYNASSMAELARHPLGNLRHLREIARTNSIYLADSALRAGIPTWLHYNERDDYFRPTKEQIQMAFLLDIELHMIPGQHDELPLYPAETLDAIERVHDERVRRAS